MRFASPLPSWALCVLLLSSCIGSEPVATLAQRPSGHHGETLRWRAMANSHGPTHRLLVGVDTDPAQLIGWSRTDRGYRVDVILTLTHDGEVVKQATLPVPVTEKRKVREDKAKNIAYMAYDAAGEHLPNGFRRAAAQQAFTFTPSPGSWQLDATIKAPPRADQRAVRVIRHLRVELQSRGGPSTLTESSWEALPAVPHGEG